MYGVRDPLKGNEPGGDRWGPVHQLAGGIAAWVTRPTIFRHWQLFYIENKQQGQQPTVFADKGKTNECANVSASPYPI